MQHSACKTNQHAFSLIELLICLAISAILLGYMSPSLSELRQRSNATSAINWIVTSVLFARHAAIVYNTIVTLCPSRNGRSCGGDWQEGAIAFTDSNADRHINHADRLLSRFEFPVPGARLSWHAFRNRHYLQMTNSGFTNYQNGNFVYCPPDGDNHFARQLVINMQGRTRLLHDIDHDGIVEDRLGHDLSCD